jgi:hypothetical protein
MTTTAKVCSKEATSGPGVGGIALRDAGQATPPARKAPPIPTLAFKKGQSRADDALRLFGFFLA